MRNKNHILTAMLIASLIAMEVLTVVRSTYAQEPMELVHVYQDRVRFSAPSGTHEWRVQVFDAEQKKLFDSGFVSNPVLDWNMQDVEGQPVSEGAYSYTLTLRDADGKKSKEPSSSLTIAGSVDSREQAPPLNVQIQAVGAPKSIKGLGTPGQLAKFTASDTINDSLITENGGIVSIGETILATNLEVRIERSQPPDTTGNTSPVATVFGVYGGKSANAIGAGGVGGKGADIVLGAGAGGNGPASGQNGVGGHIFILPGLSGNGLGVGGGNGNVLIAASGGSVGIGLGLSKFPTSKLTVAGTIESTTGGIKFPDGSIQTTAVASAGQVVKSLNGLSDNVSLLAGTNVTITPSGNSLSFSSSALSSVAHNATLSGDGSTGNQLAVAAPLTLTSSSDGPIISGINNGSGLGIQGISVNAPGLSGQGQGAAGTYSPGVSGFSTNSAGVIGSSTNSGGVAGFSNTNGHGVDGITHSTTGFAGVHGFSDGNGFGVLGQAANNAGVLGEGQGAAGTFSPGVLGTSANSPGVHATSTNAQGLFAQGLGPAGTFSPGVQGVSVNSTGVHGNSTNGAGVAGFSTNVSGVYGQHGSPSTIPHGDNNGVEGSSRNDIGVAGFSDAAQGVYGKSTSNTGLQGDSTNSAGVLGQGFGPAGTFSPGVQGNSTNSEGVKGFSTNANGVFGVSDNNVGVAGEGRGPFGTFSPGVSGFSTNDTGVFGISANHTGVAGEGRGPAGAFSPGVSGFSTNSMGVKGESVNDDGVQGVSTNSMGVRGISTNGTGVYGQGPTAGFFLGDVVIQGNLSKSSGTFKIDHPLDPENKYLYHSFVESPDMMNIYNGVVVLDKKGRVVVEMPDYFEALNRDFRYQLTAIGAPGPSLYIAKEIAGNRFVIAGGRAGMKVSWQVTGIRQDAWANAHRIKAEEEKPSNERGSYLHPELFNQSVEKAVGQKHALRATPRMKGSPAQARAIRKTVGLIKGE